MHIFEAVMAWNPFTHRYSFESTDIRTGVVYVGKLFWTKASALHCLEYHKKFQVFHRELSTELYGLEYTVFDLKTGEMFK